MVTLRCPVGLSQNLWVWKKASCNFSVRSAFSRILFLRHQGSFLAMLQKHFEWFVFIQSHVAGRREDSLLLKTTATKIFKFLLQEMFLPRISELLGWKKCGENARNIFVGNYLGRVGRTLMMLGNAEFLSLPKSNIIKIIKL